MDDVTNPADWDTLTVPLFPLPNVVLMPKAVLPLHIFEERYKVMTADALQGPRRIAMALLKAGWEKDYQSRPAVDSTVCVGRIITHELLPDGRYNFFLQGVQRATIIREVPYVVEHDEQVRPYRLAVVRHIPEILSDPQAVESGRRSLQRIFAESSFAATSLGQKYRELLKSSLPMGDLVDLIAFKFVEDVESKQKLLAEADVSRRTALLVRLLDVSSTTGVSSTVRMYGRPSLN